MAGNQDLASVICGTVAVAFVFRHLNFVIISCLISD
jgi:hypothetical protein